MQVRMQRNKEIATDAKALFRKIGGCRRADGIGRKILGSFADDNKEIGELTLRMTSGLNADSTPRIT